MPDEGDVSISSSPSVSFEPSPEVERREEGGGGGGGGDGGGGGGGGGGAGGMREAEGPASLK